MYDKRRTVVENRIQMIRGVIVAVNTTKRGFNSFDDKIFYANNFESYPNDKNLYLFERALKKRNAAPSELLRNSDLVEGKDLVIEKIKALTVNEPQT